MSGGGWARVLVAVLALGPTVAPAWTDSDDVTAEDAVVPKLPRARVLVEDAKGGVHEVDAEVAATSDARTRGLMWRESLPPGQGMLFIFPGPEEVLAFWMRNTLIPLDLVFINAAGRVVGVVENAVPHSLVRRQVGVPSRYVLEVPGGWCQQHGIKRGASARFVGLERIRVTP